MIDADALRRDLEKQCLVLAADWPGRALAAHPADMSRTIPQGFGFDVPLIMRPWDKDLGAAMDAQSVYGFRTQSGHPVLNAPLTTSSGGVIYFNDFIEEARLDAALWTMGVHEPQDDAVVACAGSQDPVNERYLHQIRILPRQCLKSVFGAKESELPPKRMPPVTIGAIVRAFLQREREHWYEEGAVFPYSLAGTAGGDGDWAKESLAFGLWVESAESCVYRVWSRPWLVTK